MASDKILIVDDDERLCRLLSRQLKQAGYDTCVAHNDNDMDRCMQSHKINLVLLDINLPGKNGLTLAQEIRNQSNMPIIFLSANADIADKVKGLEIGADDYITKPFEAIELQARIHSVLRRSQPIQSPVNTHANFAGWKLNMIKQTLSSPQGQRVDITSFEYQILSVLVSRANSPIDREELLRLSSNREWSPMDRSVDMAISKLRKKLEETPKHPSLIRTVRNAGYQLTSSVEFDA